MFAADSMLSYLKLPDDTGFFSHFLFDVDGGFLRFSEDYEWVFILEWIFELCKIAAVNC